MRRASFAVTLNGNGRGNVTSAGRIVALPALTTADYVPIAAMMVNTTLATMKNNADQHPPVSPNAQGERQMAGNDTITEEVKEERMSKEGLGERCYFQPKEAKDDS